MFRDEPYAEPTPADVALSPSLRPASDGPAFELKFLLDESAAAEVQAWTAARLAPDPHGLAELGGAYQTTTLYCDTAQGDVLLRTPGYRRHKFRLRRYGADATVYLERKTKWGQRVAKKRAAVVEDDLARLDAALCILGWDGDWFHRTLLKRGLRPACRLIYERTAFVGQNAEGPMRLTLDRRLRGAATTDWGLVMTGRALPILSGAVIVEMKYRSALPTLFKDLVASRLLSPASVSKYRACHGAWGQAPGRCADA